MDRNFLLSFEDIIPILRSRLKRKRFIHSLGAMHMATVLAQRHGEDTVRAAVAGLLHDCGRFATIEQVESEARRRGLRLPPEDRPFPKVWHALLSATIASQDFGVDDDEILHAIAVHPTGDEKMSALDKIIFLADYIEPTRGFEGLNQLRAQAHEHLDGAFRRALQMKTLHIRRRGMPLHPRSMRALAAAGLLGEEVKPFSPPERKPDT